MLDGFCMGFELVFLYLRSLSANILRNMLNTFMWQYQSQNALWFSKKFFKDKLQRKMCTFRSYEQNLVYIASINVRYSISTGLTLASG